MNISKQKQDLILTQVLNDFASCEDAHSTGIELDNESYLYYVGQKPAATVIEGTVIGDFVVPILSIYARETLSQLRDSFTEDDKLAVKLRPSGSFKNQAVEDLLTDNVNHYFFKDGGYEKLELAIKQALISPAGAWTKSYLDQRVMTDKATSKNWVEVSQFYTFIREGWDIDFPIEFQDQKRGKKGGFEWKKETTVAVDPQTRLPTENELWFVKGKIPLIKQINEPKTDVIPSCDIWVDTTKGSDFNKIRHITHRIRMTVGEAKQRGYDPEKLTKAAKQDEDSTLPSLFFSEDFKSRGEYVKNQSTDPDEQELDILEHYGYSAHIEGETRLYKTTTTRFDYLDIDEINYIPFARGQMETLLGNFYGRSLYDLAKPFQDELSVMERINRHDAIMNSFPAWQALQGNYERSHLLQNSRPGAIVEVKQIGAIQPFERKALPESFYRSQESLKQLADTALSTRNGATDFSNGVDRTSAKTVQLGLYQEGLDGSIVSKNVARTLIEPTLRNILRLVLAYPELLRGPDGQPVDLNNIVLPEDGDFICDINTSADDLAQVNQIMQMGQYALQMSQAQLPFMNNDAIYNQLTIFAKRMDLDPEFVLTSP
ncbi:hypothetical protein S918_22995 [Salmonella enterica]|nr:hypothetical protein [Salmonella enterica]